MLVTQHTGTHTDVFLSLKQYSSHFETQLWPDTDLEATFANDRNLQDVVSDDSSCPKSLLTAFFLSPWAGSAASSPPMAECIRADFGNR